MDIVICGKKISITDKNARAYEKMNGLPVDHVTVMSYFNAKYFKDDEELLQIIKNQSEQESSKFINDCIEMEVRGCSGDAFYEEA